MKKRKGVLMWTDEDFATLVDDYKDKLGKELGFDKKKFSSTMITKRIADDIRKNKNKIIRLEI